MGSLRSPLEIIGDIEHRFKIMLGEVPPEEPADRIKALIESVNRQSAKSAKPLKPPRDYLELWRKLGPNQAAKLPDRAIRYLSWEADVAVSPEFQAVALNPKRINARSLQGFMRSLHRRWKSVAGTSSPGKVAAAIMSYTGRNALIEKWKQGLQYVLHRDAPLNLANVIMNSSTTWEGAASQCFIEQDTEFGREVLKQCMNFAGIKSREVEKAEAEKLYDHVVRRILPSRHWAPGSFKAAVKQALLASPILSQRYCERLKDFVLSDSRLLDPRLPANANNWIGVGNEALNLLVQWLSAEDIQLFFDHVLPQKQSDPHGRKPFWMKYKDKVKRSRPILSYDDEIKWKSNAVTKGKRNYGLMSYGVGTSAFLLDFGSIIVVEFGKVGNAAYVYRHRNIPWLIENFWSGSRFTIEKLKRPEKAEARITHNAQWQSNMKTLLAQYGIQRELANRKTVLGW